MRDFLINIKFLRMRSLRWCLTVTILLFNLNLKAQHFGIGCELGYGKIGLSSHFKFKALSFTHDPYSCFRIGLFGYYKPDSSTIFIKTGIAYQQIITGKLWEINNLKILQIPVGVDFILGKKKYILIGSGFNFNYLNYQNEYTVKFQDSQIALFANLGFVFAINKKLSLDLKCQYDYDLTKMYTSYSYSPFGGKYIDNIYTTSFFLTATFRYN